MNNKQKVDLFDILDDPIEVFGYFLDLALSSDKPIKDEEKDNVDKS